MEFKREIEEINKLEETDSIILSDFHLHKVLTNREGDR